MKRVTAAVVAVMAGGLLAVQNVPAMIIERLPGYGPGNGGEFTVYGMDQVKYYVADGAEGTKLYSDDFGWGFQTFCLERNANAVLDPYSPDPDPLISAFAVEGGFGGGNPDPISVGTAWLYRQFSDKALIDYDYDPTGARAVSAAELQAAIWWLEEEFRSWETYSPGGNDFLVLAKNTLAPLGTFQDLRTTAAAGAYGVAAVNFTKDGVDRQSMLVRVPDGGLTVVLLGLGLAGCAVLRRRLA